MVYTTITLFVLVKNSFRPFPLSTLNLLKADLADTYMAICFEAFQ